MVHVKTKHLKNAYDAKRKSFDTYESKKAYDEYVDAVMDVAMDKLSEWRPEVGGDVVDEAVEMVSDALTGNMPSFLAPEKEPEAGSLQEGNSPKTTTKKRGGTK